MVEFRDPSPDSRKTRASKLDATLDVLESEPGRWAVVGTYKSRNSAAVAGTRWRKRAADRSFDFTFTAREAVDGSGELFGIANLPDTAAVEEESETADA